MCLLSPAVLYASVARERWVREREREKRRGSLVLSHALLPRFLSLLALSLSFTAVAPSLARPLPSAYAFLPAAEPFRFWDNPSSFFSSRSPFPLTFVCLLERIRGGGCCYSCCRVLLLLRGSILLPLGFSHDLYSEDLFSVRQWMMSES